MNSYCMCDLEKSAGCSATSAFQRLPSGFPKLPSLRDWLSSPAVRSANLAEEVTVAPSAARMIKTVVLKKDFSVKSTTSLTKSEPEEPDSDEEIVIDIPLDDLDPAQHVIEPFEETKDGGESAESSKQVYPNEAALRKDVVLKKLVRGFKRFYIAEFRKVNIKRRRRKPTTQAEIERAYVNCEQYLRNIFGTNCNRSMVTLFG